MLKKLKYKDLTWLDLESPQADEIASLAKEFDLHPLVSDELIKPSAHSKVDYYQNYTYIVLHFPHTKPNGVVETQEIDFVIGKDFIITTHYELLNSLNDFAKIFESDVKVKRETTKLSAGSSSSSSSKRSMLVCHSNLITPTTNLRKSRAKSSPAKNAK